MSRYRNQEALCWLCDFALILSGLLIVATVGAVRWWSGSIQSPTVPPVATLVSTLMPRSSPTIDVPILVVATDSVNQPTAIFSPDLINPTPISTSLSSLSDKPEYVLVFIPVAWSGTAGDFPEYASKQADYFIQQSNMDHYFRVTVKIVDEGLNSVSLSDDQLVDKIIEYGVKMMPGNRYIGITDGDLVSDGSPDVTGWTYGVDALGVVSEVGGTEIVAHELGHTFGLCDEYNYQYWKIQNEEFAGGCPNPYPADCDRNGSTAIMCVGEPSPSGANSLMGPSGMFGPYAYNRTSYDHLQSVFDLYANE